MRHSFTILTGQDGKSALASDQERSPGEERAAFEKLKEAGLPSGITRAMLMDTDLRGNVLVLERSSEENVAPGATKQKSKSKDEK